jgi:ABC-type Fe3+-siderophore transport system permease subunit
MFLPGKQPLEYHLCSGTNPRVGNQDVKSHVIIFAVYYISILLNILIPIRIYIFQKSNNQVLPSTSLGNFNNFTSEDYEIMTDLTTSICIVLLMGANLYTFSAADR